MMQSPPDLLEIIGVTSSAIQLMQDLIDRVSEGWECSHCWLVIGLWSSMNAAHAPRSLKVFPLLPPLTHPPCPCAASPASPDSPRSNETGPCLTWKAESVQSILATARVAREKGYLDPGPDSDAWFVILADVLNKVLDAWIAEMDGGASEYPPQTFLEDWVQAHQGHFYPAAEVSPSVS